MPDRSEHTVERRAIPAYRAGSLSRRSVLALPAAALALHGSPGPRGPQTPVIVVSADPDANGSVPFDRRDFAMVGIYDVDWLTTPGFARMLDNLAASPGAFHGVRFFGAFTAGQPERFLPESGGSVWVDASASIDFSATFDALGALTSRGLIPFVALGFFPPAVSPSPIEPPADWRPWQTLVRAFFEQLAADPRFGPESIAEWWFEVWNEPNEGRFWRGTTEQYLELYRATSEAVTETGLPVRLGGPAIAYKPQVEPESGAPWIERFLRFIADNPDLRCDFVSFHRKGTVTADPPDPRRLYEAAATTAAQALAIDPARFAGIPLVNNEADEKVGFEVPYAARVDERNAAWLGAVTALHAELRARYHEPGMRFVAAADNANLQLVQAPFDGRRSIMTRATPDAITDLLKVPAYGFYELLRLLGDRTCPLASGAELVFPETDLYHLATGSAVGIAALLVSYPDPRTPKPGTRTIDYAVTDIPWSRVNVARFQIDRTRSNAYTAAGGSPANPFPVPAVSDLPVIRLAQELALSRPIDRNVLLAEGAFRESIEIAPYTTLCLWITPYLETPPAAPDWLETTVEAGNVVLRWTPNREPFFFSYEVVLVREGSSGERLSPEPLRAAMWIDTAPPAGSRVYRVRAVSASGIASAWSMSDEVRIAR